MHKTPLEIRTILAAGANVVVDAKIYSMLELKALASAGQSYGGNLTIVHAEVLTVLECQQIANANKGGVTFVFE